MCEKCQRSALIGAVSVSTLGDKPRLEIFAPTGETKSLASIELDSVNVALELAAAISGVAHRILGAEAYQARFNEIGSRAVEVDRPPGVPLN